MLSLNTDSPAFPELHSVTIKMFILMVLYIEFLTAGIAMASLGEKFVILKFFVLIIIALLSLPLHGSVFLSMAQFCSA